MVKFLSTALALVSAVNAFPASMIEAAKSDPEIAARAAEILKRAAAPQPVAPLSQADAATAVFEPAPIFNAKAQYIDVTAASGHQWVAPGPSDLRGPCPGLNAFANHNFLPHNGYATISQFINATMTVVGMGPQLAAFLAVLGATIDGDGTAWSIGGTPPAGVGGPLAHLGNGISGSHNKYESDASPTRPDLYQYGNDYKVITSQAQQLFGYSSGDINLQTLTQFRAQRFVDQEANNPYFFNGPFTGVAVQPAAYTFIYRFMANHSAANPIGELTHSVFESWFALSDTGNGGVTWTPGAERIPNNWYRRALEYPYEVEYFIADLFNAATIYPMFVDVGGNTGTTNSFTGVNIANLTGGAYNSQTLLQGNNAACLAYQFAAQVKPDIALSAITAFDNALGAINSKLSCPQLQKIDQSQLMQFPGYQKSGVAPASLTTIIH